MSVKFMWKVVKNMWNKCEKKHIIHTFFHMIFHIDTPSSVHSGIHHPVPDQHTHMRTRLYNAAASPASRLHSAGSLAMSINWVDKKTIWQPWSCKGLEET